MLLRTGGGAAKSTPFAETCVVGSVGAASVNVENSKLLAEKQLKLEVLSAPLPSLEATVSN